MSTRPNTTNHFHKYTKSLMEELHQAAVAYYNNGSREQQNLAWQFFRSMDVDGSGHVSLREYSDFLYRTAGVAWVHPEIFRELDRNRDGHLDFWEVLTLYYVSRTRTIRCRTCSRPLNGLHFTCVECFETPCGETFDLCVNCYMQKTYSHQHGVFLDSYVLLRSKRNHQPPQQNSLAEEMPSRVSWWYAFRAMEVAIAVGSVAAFCTIM